MTARQMYSVKKLPPYTITETVFTPKKDAHGKHQGFDREERSRKITDGRLIMFASGVSVRVEGGDDAVAKLMKRRSDLVTTEAIRTARLTPEQAVARVEANSTANRMEDA